MSGGSSGSTPSFVLSTSCGDTGRRDTLAKAGEIAGNIGHDALLCGVGSTPTQQKRPRVELHLDVRNLDLVVVFEDPHANVIALGL